MRKLLVIFCLALPLSLFAQGSTRSVCLFAFSQEPVVPKGWKQVQACKFTFVLPSSMRERKIDPLDSCLAGFQGRDISIGLDYGWYSGPGSKTEWMTDYSVTKTKIGERDASLITYLDKRFAVTVTMVHIVTSREETCCMETALLFTIRAKASQRSETVKRIYESIRFTGQ